MGEALKIKAVRCEHGQHRVESNWSNVELNGKAWEDIYINFSGYFGDLNPNTFAAAPDLLDILQKIMPHISAEVEQRKTSGNDEYYADLEKLEGVAYSVIAKALGQ